MTSAARPANHNQGSAAEPAPRRTSGRCPLCGKPSDAAAKPFCSKRCAEIDLHRWLGGVYRVPDGAEPVEAGPVAEDET